MKNKEIYLYNDYVKNELQALTFSTIILLPFALALHVHQSQLPLFNEHP